MTERVWRDGRQLYFLFAYLDYYPIGGIGDYIATFDSVEAAEQYVNDNKDEFIGSENLDLLGLAMDGGLIHMGAFEYANNRWEFVMVGIARAWD